MNTLRLVILDFSSSANLPTATSTPASSSEGVHCLCDTVPVTWPINVSHHGGRHRVAPYSVSTYAAGTLLALPAVSVTGAIALAIDKWLGAAVDSLQPRSRCEDSQVAR